MVTAHAVHVVAGELDTVVALWHDVSRWSAWRDGFTALVCARDTWPEVGSMVEWSSRVTGGRGRVRERVVERDPLGGFTADVEDLRMWRVDRVAFSCPLVGEVAIDLSVDFRLKERAPLTVIREKLHTRGLVIGSLRRSLTRFTRELASDTELL